MFLILQIVFTILAALCVAAVIPVGALVAWGWGAFFALLAFLFFVFMKICKTQVELQTVKKGDFPANEAIENPNDEDNSAEEEKK